MSRNFLAVILICLFIACNNKPGVKVMSAKQINIPGTKIFVTPPNLNYKYASNFNGLMNGPSRLEVLDMDGDNFYSKKATFSKKTYEDNGVTVYSYQDTTIDGYPAVYLHIHAIPQYLLLFGDSTFSALMLASNYDENETLADPFRKCMLSATYHKDFKLAPLHTQNLQ